jgi:assimilatory nitrate reductase catalytic subunit
VSLPDANRVRAALARCEFVVVSDCVRDTDTTRAAHVLLPAAGWGEKDGTVTNSERRISRQRAFLPLPGEAKPDWWIVAEVARRMGFAAAFPYAGAADVFREHARLSAFENDGARDFDLGALVSLNDAEYDALTPVQWPIAADNPRGTPRLFADGRFFTPTRRARLLPITPRPPANVVDVEFPFVLNTGRVRDQWHTMTRTGKSPRLSAHEVEAYVQVHPADAAQVGVKHGALARVQTRWGDMTARVVESSEQRPGSVFVPMHWNDVFASNATVDTVVNPAIDPISGQPELKHTPARVRPFEAAWYGFLLSRRTFELMSLPLQGGGAGWGSEGTTPPSQLSPLQGEGVQRDGISYWARAKGQGVYRYELAGAKTPDDWAAWARRLLCHADGKAEWIEFFDRKGGRYRAARLVNGRLESCLFVARDPALPSRSWLAQLFEQESLSTAALNSLLAGKPAPGEVDQGQIVCACFSVGANAINAAIAGGCRSVEQIGARLKAGTNCGSCIPELKKMLQGS